MAIASTALPFVAGPTAAAADVDIMTTAYRSGKLNQFVSAAGLTGHDETLKGEGPFTVFAPSDAAFGKLPGQLLFKLLRPENKELLQTVINYHVVPGAYPSERLLKARAKVFTIPGEGGPLEINTGGEAIKVIDAIVKEADVTASNGTIHVINKVLIPADVAKALADL